MEALREPVLAENCLGFLATGVSTNPVWEDSLSALMAGTSSSGEPVVDPFSELNQTSPYRAVAYSYVTARIAKDKGRLSIQGLISKYGFNKSLVANVLGVSRTALYTWMRDPSVMTRENREKLERLVDLLEVVDEGHAFLLGKMMKFNVPRVKGRTLEKDLKYDLDFGANKFLHSYYAMEQQFNDHAALMTDKSRGVGDYSSAVNHISSMV